MPAVVVEQGVGEVGFEPERVAPVHSTATRGESHGRQKSNLYQLGVGLLRTAAAEGKQQAQAREIKGSRHNGREETFLSGGSTTGDSKQALFNRTAPVFVLRELLGYFTSTVNVLCCS